MEQFLDYFQNHPQQYRILMSIIVILILWGLLGLILRILHKNIEDPQIYYKFRKSLNLITFITTMVVMIFYWSGTFTSMSTFLGLFSAGIAIALKDLFGNVAAWLFIILRKPFRVGDRIEIGDISGDVIDLRIFQFSLMEIGNWVELDQSTGRVVHIPNYKVFSEPMANYSQGFEYIWNEISVLITFESDWKKTKNKLSQIVNSYSEHLSKEAEESVKQASKRYMIYYSKLTPIVYTNVVESGVQLTIRYLCKPRQRRNTVEEIWEQILTEFEKHSDIELAYSTQRVIINK